MNRVMKHLNQDIRSGKLLEENIPSLFNHLADHDYIYAQVRLSMHYYAFYEAYCEEEDTWSKDAKVATNLINQIIKDNILQNQSGIGREEAIKAIDDLRKDISKRMNILTAYTDVFQIFEYVLNRMEYRYKEELEQTNEVEFSKEILRYIFDSEDNFVINEKIKDIIGQLPIRITKQKYYDLLKESIHAYLGADKVSLDTYLYMIRTSAMLYKEEGMETLYPVLVEKKEALSQLNYKNLTKQEYDQAVQSLQVATLILETETTVYFGLAEIVNEVYAMLLCSTYAGMVPTETEAAGAVAMQIIREINDIFVIEEKVELTMDLIEKFTDIEGVQEELSFELAQMEDTLFEVNLNHKALVKSLMLDQILQVLLYSQKLLASSLFIDLGEENEDETVEEEIVAKETALIQQELMNLFDTQDKIISRAVIANTINKMPVFFKDHKEVMDYVLYSLERCTDSYEKTACVEIINTIMAE